MSSSCAPSVILKRVNKTPPSFMPSHIVIWTWKLWMCLNCLWLLLLFAMIRSVVKSFKVPGVEVVASRMSNEAALTRMIDSKPKKNLVILDAGPGWMS